jgi:hypothetical protein
MPWRSSCRPDTGSRSAARRKRRRRGFGHVLVGMSIVAIYIAPITSDGSTPSAG